MTEALILENRFKEFLRAHLRKDDQSITLTSMGLPMRGSFHIPNEEYRTFIDLYDEIIREGRIIPALIERHPEDLPGPIVIDIDFKVSMESTMFDDDENPLRSLTFEEHIQPLIVKYQEKIKLIYDIKEDSQLNAYVFLRNRPYVKDVMVKDGIHIMFPNIPSMPESQYFLREQMIRDTDVINIFKSIPGIKSNTADIIDKSVIKTNGWMMYGSSKPGISPYQLYYIIDFEGSNIYSDDDVESDLPYFFSIRRFNKEDAIEVKEEFKKSVHECTQIREDRKSHAIRRAVIRREGDTKLAIELTKLLSEERSDNYLSWIEVGWCLHNMDPDNTELIDAWEEFSKKSSKYSTGICHKEWEKMKTRADGYTIGSLRFWAQQDNPDAYAEIIGRNIREVLERSKDKSDSEKSVAEVFYQMAGDMFKYVPPDKDGGSGWWFEFNNHRWILDGGCVSLSKCITGSDYTGISLRGYFIQMIEYYNEKITTTDDEREIKNYEEQIERFTGIAKKLETTAFLDKVIKFSRLFFRDRKFYDRLDENPYLLGFNNGVYDFKHHEFREGQPSDYLSFSTGYDYVPLSEDSRYVDDINDFMEKIIPNDEVRDYIWKVMGSFLVGITGDNKFRLWVGVGGNGKSILNNLLAYSLGQYSSKIPITLFTGKRNASFAASPELANTKGRRYVYAEEPKEGANINVGLLKELTGGDLITCRDLYKPQAQFKPQFKIAMLTNHLPKIPHDDEGLIRRLEVVDFVAKFREKLDPKDPLVFLKDPTLEQRSKEWTQNFIAMLIDKYYDYIEDIRVNKNMTVPSKVLRARDEYLTSMDPCKQFLQLKLNYTGTHTDKISIHDLYELYNEWANKEAGGKRADIMSAKDFRTEIIKKFKLKKTSRIIRGYIIVEDAEIDEESDHEDDIPNILITT